VITALSLIGDLTIGAATIRPSRMMATGFPRCEAVPLANRAAAVLLNVTATVLYATAYALRKSGARPVRSVNVVASSIRNAIAAEDALSGRTALPDEALLVAAYRATQYNAYIRRRATYDELTSTGDIGLIRDTALRELAMHTYTADVFNEIILNGRSSEFRIAFRKAIPRDVQTTLSERCGDRLVPIGDYAAIEHVLDYPCTTTLPAAAIASSVAIIRADPNFAAALRLRIADLGTDLGNLTWFYKDDLRDKLRALAKEAP